MSEESKEMNRNVWKRSGYRSIYMRLLSIGCFKEPDRSPLESVRLANSVEAIKILSLKNTGI